MSLQENLVKGARVYRWGDHVALSWPGVANSNHYLTPEVAEALSTILMDYAHDIRVNPFQFSHLGTMLVAEDGTTEKE
jgi:hypothetical protein